MNDGFIPKGAASFKLEFDGPPVDFYFLLLPRLTMLAFSSAVEPLRIANQVTNKELFRWFTMTPDGLPVRCSNRVLITPDRAMEPVPREAYSFVCSGTEPLEACSDDALFWIRRQRAFGGRVGGICSGAFALAKAGVLEDRQFTLHWENQPSFQESFPGLVPTPNLYENDSGLMTCGGGGAATDMMLDLIEREHGRDLAIVVADMCIHARSHNREAPQKSAYSVVLGSRNTRLIKAMQMMQDNIEEPVDVSDIADEIQISRRQLERLFKRYVNMTPNRFYYDLRISRAHALLNETNMTVTEISIACGFSSTGQFGKRFKEKFGVSPQGFRKGWMEN